MGKLGIEKGLTVKFYDFDFVNGLRLAVALAVLQLYCPGPVLSTNSLFITSITYSRGGVKLQLHRFLFYNSDVLVPQTRSDETHTSDVQGDSGVDITHIIISKLYANYTSRAAWVR